MKSIIKLIVLLVSMVFGAALLAQCSGDSAFRNAAAPTVNTAVSAKADGKEVEPVNNSAVGDVNSGSVGDSAAAGDDPSVDDPSQKVGSLTNKETAAPNDKTGSSSEDPLLKTGTTPQTNTSGSTGQTSDNSGANVVVTEAKVGINFEDGGLKGSVSDKDYNDAVLCFNGKFAVDFDAKTIKSTMVQTVVARFSRRAACQNYMKIVVLDAAGTETFNQRYTTTNGSESQISIPFQIDSQLKVYLQAGSDCNNTGSDIGIDNNSWSLVAADECRTTGN